MKKILYLLLLLSAISCGRKGSDQEKKIITVSIAPFKYFVETIAKDEYEVNVMVPAGSNPHIYEPFPDQIRRLKKSVAYISNGFLGFEITWLDRFYEMNRTMRKLSLGESIDPIKPEHQHDGEHVEGADPHYWVSPECAYKMASSVQKFLTGLNPDNQAVYDKGYQELIEKIRQVDVTAKQLSSSGARRSFMIYHPNLDYLSRDYNLEEIPVEHEGKEPSPSRMKYLIDRANNDNLKIILVQREYDTKNARAIADETGAKVVIIDPLSEDWYSSTIEIISILKDSFEANKN